MHLELDIHGSPRAVGSSPRVAVSDVTGQVTSVTDETRASGHGQSRRSPAKQRRVRGVRARRKPVTMGLGRPADVTDAVNEVAGTTPATARSTSASPGRFSDATAATFTGIVQLVLPTPSRRPGLLGRPVVNTTATGDVLLGSQGGALGDTTGRPAQPSGSRGRQAPRLAPSTTPTGPLRSPCGQVRRRRRLVTQHQRSSCTTATAATRRT